MATDMVGPREMSPSETTIDGFNAFNAVIWEALDATIMTGSGFDVTMEDRPVVVNVKGQAISEW